MKLSPRACHRAAAAPGQRPARGEPSLPPSLFPVPVSPPPCPAGAGAARRTAAAARMLPPLPGLCRAAPGGGRHPRPRPALSDAPSIHSAPPARPGSGPGTGTDRHPSPCRLSPPSLPPRRSSHLRGVRLPCALPSLVSPCCFSLLLLPEGVSRAYRD